LDAGDRRVRKLRVRAGSDALVRRGAILFEDALRTATLPGGDGRGLLVIKRLALGRISGDSAASSLALRLSERVRALAVHAQPADEEHTESPAVWFPDEIEPIVQLALRVARRQAAQAWFWPLAVKGYSPSLPPRRVWEVLVEEALHTPAAGQAVVALVEALVEARVLEPLVAELQPTDGEALLHSFGWVRPRPGMPVPPAEEATHPLPPPWQAALAPLVRRLGGDDPRVVWLVAVALVAVRPARILDRGLGMTARRVAERLRRAPPPAPTIEPRPPAPAPAKPPVADNAPPPAPEAASPPARPTAEEPAAPPPAPPPAGAAPASAPPRPAPPPDSPLAPPPEPEEPPRRRRSWSRRRPLLFGEPVATEWAGLYFLLRALVRLGLPAMLAESPELIELDFAQRILLRLARKLDIPDDDPILAPLPLYDEAPPPVRFVMPQPWLRLADPGVRRLRRLRDVPGLRLLDDAGGMPLALWQNVAPPAARALCASGVRRAPATDSDEPDIEAWCVAVERHLERDCELTLRELVHRRGQICVTRTHLDVLFDLEDADLRVRQAGLDFNLGWLPWFGRVVVFHFLEAHEVL
jgi:hypothetical protein